MSKLKVGSVDWFFEVLEHYGGYVFVVVIGTFFLILVIALFMLLFGDAPRCITVDGLEYCR